MRTLLVLAVLAATAAMAGCTADESGEPTDETPPAEAGPLEVTGPFDDQGDIPVAYTCDGEERSPPLRIANLPNGTVSVALRVLDPDAPVPEAPALTIVHWLVWNVTPEEGAVEFPEGGIPEGARQGANTGGDPAYMGPCPPAASNAHRYIFTAYALDAPLDLEEGAGRDEFEAALEGHVLAEGTLTGRYQRAPA